MITAFIISVFSTAVVSFVAGAKYGRTAEQALQAEFLKLKQSAGNVQQKITADEQKAIDRLRNL